MLLPCAGPPVMRICSPAIGRPPYRGSRTPQGVFACIRSAFQPPSDELREAGYSLPYLGVPTLLESIHQLASLEHVDAALRPHDRLEGAQRSRPRAGRREDRDAA